jgi:3-hydroxyacyl-CoA dehydrogenase / enoyl-CoA hydratase / 3-hydroxybutyryl-CoA epimerase
MKERIKEKTKDDELITWTLERKDGKPNLIDETFLDEMEDLLANLEKRKSVKGLVIRSAHPGVFLAGADLSKLSKAKGDELESLLKRGQDAFARLSNLPFPTACAINGACLGGGFEFALACDRRILSACPKALMGLPETSLGLLPGWGGCYRLPRLVGLLRALPIVAGGKPVRPRKARALGLVDEIVPPELTERAAVESLAKGRIKRNRFFLGNFRPLSTFACHRALGAVKKKTRGHYPAPLAAIKVMSKSIHLSLERAMKLEREAFAGLAKTSAARNLVRYFFLRERAKKINFPTNAKALPEIRRVHVVGAGKMGGGIAQWLASRGIEVALSDLSPDALALGLSTVDDLLGKARIRGILTNVEAREAMDRITPVCEKIPLREGDLVIEAIVERIGAKRSLFAELDERAPKGVPFATNTSSLSVDSMSVAMKNHGRLGGLHFFNPVHRMELIEVIRAKRTDPAVTQALLDFVRRIGKRAVLCKDSPGFLVNRILVPYLVEAAILWENGHAIEEIDGAMLDFGMPMGPLRLLDEIGLDVSAHVANELKFRLPRLGSPPKLLEQLVERDFLGRKAGAGFYRYGGKKGSKLKVNEEANDLRKRVKPERMSRGEMVERMTLVMLNESARCLEEGVVENPEDVDFGMIAGTGWAPFRGGPLRYADTLGLTEVSLGMEKLHRKEGERFEPSKFLVNLARYNETFYGGIKRTVPDFSSINEERIKP